ncbi:MAG TPA: MurR/RpiR family transcriptional regulator [Woeseiaceae bacterium]|nr:MurR/RpiR family transcriptional regulator [Woeseiaceae bacterium]
MKIRAERDDMSAIERRIADFILTEAHLLRDYSSQQLANALKISQSSVVKFSQKLGFKGYPDLKYSIGESLARNESSDADLPVRPEGKDSHAVLAENLWHFKSLAEQETRLINPPAKLDLIADLIDNANKVFIIGLGEDGILARAFTMRLTLLQIDTALHCDTAQMTTRISMATPGDVLLLFSEYGQQLPLCRIGRQMQEQNGKVVAVTRHNANPVRALSDESLLVSAHDDRIHIEPLLYQAALRHLLDTLFMILCEKKPDQLVDYASNLDRIKDLHNQ